MILYAKICIQIAEKHPTVSFLCLCFRLNFGFAEWRIIKSVCIYALKINNANDKLCRKWSKQMRIDKIINNTSCAA